MLDNDTPTQGDSASQADRLDEIVAGYLRAVERGETPSREELLARYPELADELREFFADHDRMAHLAQPLFDATLAPSGNAAPPERIRYFGDYELLEEIARGGMGVVYKARQVRLNRIVAVKMILSGQLASPADVERFHTEAEAAAKLDYPGIVPIYEVGEHEGQHYFSMGFVDGQSLSTRVAQGPLPAREAAAIARTVAEAVQYAHENGVVHRDLKPGNILLDRQGRPRVTDFGLAKLTESGSDLTGTGQVLGTPSYMPPEQAAAQVSAVGRLSDIYSLGAILYCLLTGRPPFQAATPVETLLQVQKQEPVSPRQLNPALPLDLDTIVLKCLDKSPQRRYPSAQALADELGRYLNGEPITARPISSVARLARWCQRKPAIAALMLVTSIFTVVLICGLITSNMLINGALTARTAALHDLELEEAKTRNALDEKSEALAGRIKAFQELQKEQKKTKEALEREGKAITAVTAANNILTTQSQMLQERQRALYRSMLKLAHEQALGNNILLADKNLESIPEELRGWEWRYAKRLCHPDVLSMPGQGSVQFTPDGRHAVTCIDNRVELRSIPGGEVGTVMKGHTGQVDRVAISPDGARVASAAADNTIRVWAAESGDLLATLESPCRVHDIALSPDQLQIAGACADSLVRIWAIDTGELSHTLPGRGVHGVCVAYSPDGESLIAGTAASLTVWNTRTGNERSEFKNLITWSAGLEGENKSGVQDVAFSPKDDTLAVANADIVRILDAKTFREMKTFAGHVGGIQSVAFSPDGRMLATASSDGTVRLWDVDTGENRRTFPWHKGVVRSVAFGPGGRWLASATDAEIKFWDLSADFVVTKLPIHTDAAYALSFSRDGNLLVTGGGRYSRVKNQSIPGTHGEVRILNLSTNRVVFSKDLDFPFRFGVLAVALNGQGNKVAASGYIGTRVWELETGQQLLHLSETDATGETWSVCFSPDEKYLVTSGGSKTTSVCELSSGKFVKKLGGQGFAQFSPDGTLLAVCNDRLSVWDFPGGEPELAAEIRSPQRLRAAWRLAFNPDGTRIAVCLDTRQVAADEKSEFARIFDAKTGEILQSLKSVVRRDFDKTDYISSVYDVCFSPDGKRIATASGDKTVRIWDAQTGDELLILDHPNQVFCVQFSPDGKRLASGSGHWCGPRVGEVRIWNSF